MTSQRLPDSLSAQISALPLIAIDSRVLADSKDVASLSIEQDSETCSTDRSTPLLESASPQSLVNRLTESTEISLAPSSKESSTNKSSRFSKISSTESLANKLSENTDISLTPPSTESSADKSSSFSEVSSTDSGNIG